jgi:hypothetical protein
MLGEETGDNKQSSQNLEKGKGDIEDPNFIFIAAFKLSLYSDILGCSWWVRQDFSREEGHL